jgi:hypothetical protein
MRNLKICVIALISFLYAGKLSGCGYYGDEFSNYSFFNPKYVLAEGRYARLMYDDIGRMSFEFGSEKDANIKEWLNYFGKPLTYDKVDELVYKLPAESLKEAMKGTSNSAVLNTIARMYKKEMAYLIFSKQIEQYCNNYDYWDDSENDIPEILKYADEAFDKYSEESDQFLKSRWGFQYIKLLRYGKKYDRCHNFYKNNYVNVDGSELMKYWALNHIAGVQIILGSRVTGLYNFVKVFANSPGNRSSVYYSLKFKTDNEWDDVLARCKTNDERIALYFNRALAPASVGMYDIEKIYEIDPASDFLPSLITREINKIEAHVMDNDMSESVLYKIYNNKNTDKQIVDYINRVNRFIDIALVNKRVKTKDFYRVAKSYLKILTGKLDESKSIVAKVSEKGKKEFKKQLDLNRSLTALLSIESDDLLNGENRFMKVYNSELESISLKWLQLMRGENSNMEFMFKGGISTLRSDLNIDNVKKLIAVENDNNKSEFIKRVLIPNYWKYFIHNEWRKEKKSDKKSYRLMVLKEMLATAYLKEDKLEKARDLFTEVKPKVIAESYPDFYLSYNPFNFYPEDKINIDKPAIKYSKLKFVNILIKIKGLVDTDKASTFDYFLLGNAYYNTTYFGVCWNAKEYYRSSYEIHGNADCSVAFNNYVKAYKSTTDKEMKAKCLFGAAKARQSNYYIYCNKNDIDYRSVGWNPESVSVLEKRKIDMGYRKEFDMLKDEYSNTNYVNDIINECSYYWLYSDK